MRAVVTRPIEDADRIAAPLRARGVDVFIEPLMAVVPAAAADVQTDGVQAFLLTSANGARALAANLKEHPHAFALPTYCVGDQTLRVAGDLGFVHLHAAEGDVDSLAALVRAEVDPARGSLLHAAGSVVAGDLKGMLEEAGYTVRRQPLYEARTAKGFSRELQALLRDGLADAVLLYSPRTARTFADLATDADLRDACSGMTAYCLSQAVADALGDLPFHRLRVAPAPNQEALLTVFDEDNAHAFVRTPSEAGTEDARGDGTMTERPKAGKTGQSGNAKKPDDKTPPATAAPSADDTAKAAKDAKAPEAKTPAEPKAPADAKAKAEPKDSKPAAGAKPAAASAPSASKPASAVPSSSAASSSAASSPPASTSSAAPAAKGGVSGAVVGVLVLLLVLVGAWATLPIWVTALPPQAQDMAAPLLPGGGASAQVAGLEEQAARLEGRVSDLSGTVRTLQQRIADLEARPVAPATDGAGNLSAEAERTLEDLRQRIDALAAASGQPDTALDERLAALDGRLATLQASRAEASTVLNLTDRLSQVEEALRRQEARQAQAVAFLVTVGQVRQAVDTGRPFLADLRSMRAVAPQGLDVAGATAGWGDLAGQGLPSLTTLRQSFAAQADVIIRASVDLDAGTTWWDRTADRLMSVVSIRRTDGEAVGDGVAAIVSRAERALETGSLAAAIAEVETLTGPAGEAAAGWLAGARARLAAEAGLADLTGEALARLQAAQVGAGAGVPADGETSATGQGG